MLTDGLMQCLLDEPASQMSINHCCIEPAACNAGAAGAFPAQQGLIQLPDISGFDPSVPLFYDRSQLLGNGFSSRVYRAGCYEDMLRGQAPFAVKVCCNLTVGHSWCCLAFLVFKKLMVMSHLDRHVCLLVQRP